MRKTNYKNKGSKDNLIVSIAGAHGVGKSTIFNFMKQKFKENPKFKFFPVNTFGFEYFTKVNSFRTIYLLYLMKSCPNILKSRIKLANILNLW